MSRSIATVSALLAGLLGVSAFAIAQDAPKRPLEFDELGRVGRIYSPRAPRASWDPTGTALRIGGKYLDPITGETVKRPKNPKRAANPTVEAARAAFRDAFPKKRLAFSASRRRSTVPRHPEGSPGLLVAKKAPVAALVVDDDVWVWREGTGVTRLTESGKTKRKVKIAPSGRAVSFIEAMDLYVVETESGAVHRLSEDGGENTFYGELDWVLQEEVWGRGQFNANWWAPTGDHLAYLRIDEEGVPTYTVLHWVPTHPKRENLKYPKAGDTNPRMSLHIAGVDGKVVAVDLSRYAEFEFLIVRVGWTPDGAECLFQVQNREQTWLELCAADPKTGASRVVVRDESKSWVNILDGIHWLEGGDFIWESERTGFRHLYRYDRSGKLVTTITSGEWQVRSIVDIDEKRGEIVFRGTKDGAVNRNYYVVGIDGKGLRRLTPGDGWHTVRFNEDKSLYIDSFSSVAHPGYRRLYKRDGTLVRELAEASMRPEAAKRGFSQPELVQIPTRDGGSMDAVIVKPLPFDETKAHPVWITSYFGPAAPSVRNRWNGSAWFQFLAQQGVVVMQLNVRSASDAGQKFTALAYQQLGAVELEDLVDAVDWLTGKPWADAERVGLTGYSYGGFMTAYAMLRTEKFRLGFAGGGVYDWRNYDTIYTERYMRTPQNNPKGYDRTSCIKHAKGLKGHLVIHHGTIDENVHMQNALQLVHALQAAGKGGPGESFELMLYPRNRHGFQTGAAAEHNRRYKWRVMRDHLLPKE